MIGTLLDNVTTMGELFTEIAMGDPLSAVLIAVGNVLMFGAMAVFGYMALGGLLDLVTPGARGRAYRPRD